MKKAFFIEICKPVYSITPRAPFLHYLLNIKPLRLIYNYGLQSKQQFIWIIKKW